MRNKKKSIKRGYLFTFFASLILACLYTFQSEFIARRTSIGDDYQRIGAKMIILFLLMFIPGYLLTRWHYKVNKNKY